MKKKILITGSGGMLGTDLILTLDKKFEVLCTDIAENRHAAYKNKEFLRCDITNKKRALEMIKKAGADVVIHTAAWTDVDGCELDRENAMKINFRGTHNIAIGCKETGALMFYLSSDFVFDGDKSEPYVEDDSTNPLNVYGLSKLKGEEAVKRELGRYFIVRTSWLFGKYGKNFVDIILDRAERRKELRVVMDQFGSPTYTADLSAALENLVSLALKDGNLGGIYHFCNTGSCSWYRYAEEILRISEKQNAKIVPITSTELDLPARRPTMSILNVDKYSKLCNGAPRDWQSALRNYLTREQSSSERSYAQDTKR